MITREQVYYELLARTDHPVFLKDFSSNTDINSDLNSIRNRVIAKQLDKFRSLIEELRINTYPATVTALTIDDWENQYFGFVKAGTPLAERVLELVIKFNKTFHMNVGDVVNLSQAIVGVSPTITRNISRGGWTLGQGSLGLSTALITSHDPNYAGFYLVAFPVSVDSDLLAKLDTTLTTIEKAGSKHKLISPVRYWILGRAPLGINTTLGVN